MKATAAAVIFLFLLLFVDAWLDEQEWECHTDTECAEVEEALWK